jgi:hypothetical protein
MCGKFEPEIVIRSPPIKLRAVLGEAELTEHETVVAGDEAEFGIIPRAEV